MAREEKLSREITADVLVVGAGHAGGVLARALREHGFPGAIALVGEEAHLPHERPPLSKELLRDEGFQVPVMATAEQWRSSGVELFLDDPVVGVDKKPRIATLASGLHLRWKTLVLATGARPRTIAGPDHPGRLTLRTIDDALAILHQARKGSRAVVIGGGTIGLEVAAGLSRTMRQVTVVEGAPELMQRCAPRELAGEIAALHRANGVEVITGSPVASLTANGITLRVEIAAGRMLEADLVVEGIGVAPDTRIADMLGLAVADGVSVDAHYRTGAGNIYAIGDCACPPGGRQESWAHAEWSARATARDIIGLAPEQSPVPWFWSDQFQTRFQVAGAPGIATHTARMGGAWLYLHDETVVGVAALGAQRDFSAARRLVGKPLPGQENQRPPIASVTLRQPS